MDMLRRLMLACAVFACSRVSGADRESAEYCMTTDKGIRVDMTIVEREDLDGKRLILKPRRVGNAKGKLNVPTKLLAEVVGSAGELKSIRFNDFYEDGFVCVWVVEDDSRFHYRWATWIGEESVTGAMKRTEEMRTSLFNVRAVWNNPTSPPNDAFSAILEARLGPNMRQTLLYHNNCAIGSVDGLGEYSVLIPRPLKH